MYSTTLAILAIAISVWSQVSGNIFDATIGECAEQKSPPRKSVCINIGGGEETVGPYLADKGLVTYIGQGSGSKPNFFWRNKLKNVPNILAYARQRTAAKQFGFRVAVDDRFTYTMKFGFACIGACPHKQGNTTIIINGEITEKLDVHHVGTESEPPVLSVPGVMPNNQGNIMVIIMHPKVATLATLCVEKEPEVIPECTQKGCNTFYGNYNYSFTYGSLFNKSSGSCSYKKESFSHLDFPKSATVVSAFLTWSAIGTPVKSKTTIRLDKQVVFATWTEANAGYWAQAEVTDIVSNSGNGFYRVEDMEHDEDDRCDFGFASWTLVVIYTKEEFPVTNINVCAFGHVSQFSVQCLIPKFLKRAELFMAVTQTDRSHKDDDLFINDELSKSNVYDEDDGAALDIFTEDITSYDLKGRGLTIRDSQTDEQHVYLTVVTKETT